MNFLSSILNPAADLVEAHRQKASHFDTATLQPTSSFGSNPATYKDGINSPINQSSISVDKPAEGAMPPGLKQGIVSSQYKHNDNTTSHDGEAQKGEEYAKDQQVRRCSFERFVSHRMVGNSIDIQVQWNTSDHTWEPEADLYEDVPRAVLAYWKKQGGRPVNPEEPALYTIAAVWGHRNNGTVWVEWVGYGLKERTWEPREVVEAVAPELLVKHDVRIARRANRIVKRQQTKPIMRHKPVRTLRSRSVNEGT